MDAAAVNKGGAVKDVIKALILSVIISIILILIFALMVKYADFSEGVIKPVNIGIKTISIFLGCLLGFGTAKMNFLKGIIFGLLYILLSFLIFSALSQKIDFSVMSFWDIVFGVAVGGISGIIANLKG